MQLVVYMLPINLEVGDIITIKLNIWVMECREAFIMCRRQRTRLILDEEVFQAQWSEVEALDTASVAMKWDTTEGEERVITSSCPFASSSSL